MICTDWTFLLNKFLRSQCFCSIVRLVLDMRIQVGVLKITFYFIKNVSSLFMVFAFCLKFKMLFTLGWELYCCGACKLLKPRVFVKSGEEVNFLRYSKLCIFRWLSLFEIQDLTVSRVLDSYRPSGRGRTQYPSIFAHTGLQLIRTSTRDSNLKQIYW